MFSFQRERHKEGGLGVGRLVIKIGASVGKWLWSFPLDPLDPRLCGIV